ncbi:Membrane protein involved in the export of O-antigen and teichoic acid [Micromonospora rhizosphaerae]|uniref:Membrane protein involved in the export of O-antigen and teichoic acid n=1 Tax=Micromonospora rhizosphaerae TaxID=568872 RepID=A0A1C6S4J4_9ACTN|nr:polysaccharide biosynthesis C-terminal domain-containing protein [Micromonospora rhizosphaerae]SCL24195.1 Membrane protein involved in the export of O-antigen and teichoic acid [Micromonospora rhizosphaerae]
MSVATRDETAAKGGVLLVARFAVIALLNYALGIVLAWLLSDEEYGQVSTVQAALLLAAYTVNSGFPWIVATTEARRGRIDPGYAGAVFRSSLLGNTAFGLALAFGFVFLQAAGVRLLPPESLLMVAMVAASFPIFAVNAVFKGALHGRRRFSAFGLVQVAEVLVKCLVAVVLVVALNLGAAAVACAFLAGSLVAAVLGAWRLRDDLPLRGGRLAGISTYRSTLPMFVGSAGFALFATADVLGLHSIGYASGLTATTVAMYQVAVLLGRAPYFVADALVDAVFPFIARRHDSPESSHRWFSAAARWIFLAVVPIELVLVVRPQPFLQLFFPAAYQAVLPLIQVVSLGALGMIGCGIYGKSLQALGRRGAVATVMPAVLVVEFTVLAVLVPRLAAMGAAIAFALAGWTGALLLALTYHRHQRIGLPGRDRAARYAAALLALLGGLAVTPQAPAVLTLGLVTVAGLAYLGVARSLNLITSADVSRLRGLADKARLLPVGAMPPIATATVRALRTGWGRYGWRRARLPAALMLALLALTGLLFTANITTSPDTQYDEVVYTRAAQQVATTGELTWSTEPVFVHPPLYFLLQSAWLKLLGLGDAPLFDAIHAARLITATAGAVDVVLLGLLCLAVTPTVRRGRRLLLVAAVVVVAATDPVLLRYSRLAMIEPLALLGCLVTILVSWRARHWSTRRHLLVVGLLTGMTLLVKEISVFLLLSPVVFGALASERRYLRRAAGSLAIGCTFWLAFPLWAALLGASGRFWEVKLFTLQRLLGLLQVTGWNRPGVSFTAAVTRSAPQYLSTYLLLALGAVALVWLFLRRNNEAATYLLAFLGCSYTFAAYILVQGTLNEQFFVYIVPAAIIGALLGLDALLTALLSRARTSFLPAMGTLLAGGLAVGLAALLPVTALLSWGSQYARSHNNGIEQMSGFVDTHFPACATFNTSGDVQKYVYSLQGQTVTRFGSGPGALAHGVHFFFLNPKDAISGYGRMSPDLADWIRSNGHPVATYASNTHHGVQLWEVKPDQYEQSADLEPIHGGVFVHTVGSRCGGFSVKDDADGLFLREFGALGGKSVVGAPISRPWRQGDRAYQAFNGVLMESSPRAPGRLPAVRSVPAVAGLATQHPATYRRYQLPPIRYPDTARPPTSQVLGHLNDVRIARAYLGVPLAEATDSDVARALDHLGSPLGPATTMPDGAVRQAFSAVIFERPAVAADVVRLAPVGRALDEARHVVPASAAQPQAPPPLPAAPQARLPSTVAPLITSLAGLLLAHLAVSAVLARPRRLPRRTVRPSPASVWTPDTSKGPAS